MSSAEFGALLVLATAASFTPGPNTTLSTAIAANRGLRGALRFVCAVPAGWGLMLVQALPPLRWGVLAAGVGYMLWLAGRLAPAFVEGMALQLLNVKAWMLALTVAAGWVAGRPDWLARLLQVLPVMLFFGFASNFTYALIGALLRRWLARGRRLLWFNRAMAAALAATAAWMAWTALSSPTGLPPPAAP